MGWFWASPQGSSSTEQVPVTSNSTDSKCPMKTSSKSSSFGACPVVSSKSVEKINPLNNMPEDLSSERAPSQKLNLPTERTISSIPKGEKEDEGLWEYPSPQQMYNAMLRKGKAQDIPEDAVESMVDVHNFLNEGAWQQILDWEQKYTLQSQKEPRLLKFVGKPHDLSPRAWSYLQLSKIFPNTFSGEAPFDRHDWTVLRYNKDKKDWQQVRYVIDYYSAPDDEDTDMPAFVLDTRPALDSVSSCVDRFSHWAGPLWQKAMGDIDKD